MAELTYVELTKGRQSTRLPHTHKFTSFKNVVISALYKIDKRIHIQASVQLSKEEYAGKRIHNGCLVQIEIRQASRCWTVTVVTEFSIRSSQPLKILIIKKMCNVRTFVTHEYEIFFVHTDVTYENVIWPNLC